MARAAFYAVARGHHPGVYATWDECQKEVIGYRAASFKKFDNVLEAERFAGVKSCASRVPAKPGTDSDER
jgi:viroplasmin and RNaseH domain-containing protein